ncbi:MAG: hypothetical protein ABJE95_19825 [Byssovorax sp.]
MRYLPWLLVLTLSLGASSSALAQASDAHAAAEEQFRQGRDALARSDYPAALQFFRKSNAMEPGRGKLLNLAICEEQLGQLTEATTHFQEVLPQLTPDDERLTIAQKHLAALAPRLAHVRVDLAISSPPGATVSADGAPLAKSALGAEVPVNPGKHAITVTAPGRADRRYDLTLDEGKTAAITVEPGEPSARAPAAPAVAAPTRNRRTLGFVVGGVGVAGLAAGAVTGILALGDHAAAVKACPSKVGCSISVVDQARAGQSLSVVSTVAFAVGAAAAGVGVALVLSGGSSPTPAASTSVGVALLPGGGGVALSGAF